MNNGNKRVERAVELLIYAPLGAGLSAIDVAPSLAEMFVNRARGEIDRRHEQVSQHITTVRSMGQVAVAFGVPMARDRARSLVVGRTRPASSQQTPRRSAPVDLVMTPAAPPAPMPELATEPLNDAPSSEELPIPGYDALSASQVVERLTGLAPPELGAVHAYEATHRQRRTILGKIEQLAG
jgi:hypothetical protein